MNLAVGHLQLQIQEVAERYLILQSSTNRRLQFLVWAQLLSDQWLFAVKMVAKQLQFVQWFI